MTDEAVWLRLNPSKGPRIRWLDEAATGNKVLVLTLDGEPEPIAKVTVQPDSDGKAAEIHLLNVKGQYQGQHWGSLLLTIASSFAESKYGQVWIPVRTPNRTLWSRAGFEPVEAR